MDDHEAENGERESSTTLKLLRQELDNWPLVERMALAVFHWLTSVC